MLYMSNHYAVHLKLIQCVLLYVNYILKLEKNNFKTYIIKK